MGMGGFDRAGRAIVSLLISAHGYAGCASTAAPEPRAQLSAVAQVAEVPVAGPQRMEPEPQPPLADKDGRAEPQPQLGSPARQASPEATITEISAETAREMRRHSWRLGCPVPIHDLRSVQVPYRDLDGAGQLGELIVHEQVAAEVAEIFQEIYASGFLIEQVRRIDDFSGSDDESVAANNTSAFNCRPTTGKAGGYSSHAYGVAIDVNPLRNPYVKRGRVIPPEGRAWLDRTELRPGMIVAGDAVHQAFTSRGWRWGGDWRSLKDYQHFEKKAALPRLPR